MTTTKVPTWTLGDKLRKARRMAGLSTAEMAAEIGVTERTILNYEADKTPPKRTAIRTYAELTGVPLTWLEDQEPAVYQMDEVPWWEEPTLEGVEWHDWLKAS